MDKETKQLSAEELKQSFITAINETDLHPLKKIGTTLEAETEALADVCVRITEAYASQQQKPVLTDDMIEKTAESAFPSYDDSDHEAGFVQGAKWARDYQPPQTETDYIKKLEFMIDNGLGWEDMEDDTHPMYSPQTERFYCTEYGQGKKRCKTQCGECQPKYPQTEQNGLTLFGCLDKWVEEYPPREEHRVHVEEFIEYLNNQNNQE